MKTRGLVNGWSELEVLQRWSPRHVDFPPPFDSTKAQIRLVQASMDQLAQDHQKFENDMIISFLISCTIRDAFQSTKHHFDVTNKCCMTGCTVLKGEWRIWNLTYMTPFISQLTEEKKFKPQMMIICNEAITFFLVFSHFCAWWVLDMNLSSFL